jgi:hypothetical protein
MMYTNSKKDPYKIKSRFYAAHRDQFQLAKSEITLLFTNPTWFKFFFPAPLYVTTDDEFDLDYLEFCLRSEDEVIAYLSFNYKQVNLRNHYIEMLDALLTEIHLQRFLHRGRSYKDTFGDATVFRVLISSIMMFESTSILLEDNFLHLKCSEILRLMQ